MNKCIDLMLYEDSQVGNYLNNVYQKNINAKVNPPIQWTLTTTICTLKMVEI